MLRMMWNIEKSALEKVRCVCVYACVPKIEKNESLAIREWIELSD